MIELTIGNQGKYAEGVLAVDTLKLPATTEAVQAALSHIGVDGRRYEEIYIAQCETDVPGLASHIGEYESIDELNYLAALMEELGDAGELDKFEAAVALGEYTGERERPYQSGPKPRLLRTLPRSNRRGKIGLLHDRRNVRPENPGGNTRLLRL